MTETESLSLYRHTDEDGDQIKIESWPNTPILLVYGFGHDQHTTSVRLDPGAVRELTARLTTWLLEHDPSPARVTTDTERVRAVLETEAVVGRSALEYRGLISSALMADEAPDPSPSPARIPMNSRCLRCGHTYGVHTHGTSEPCDGEQGVGCDCLRWTGSAPAPIPSPRSEWSDFARRREALRAAVTVWTAVDNIAPETDAEDVIAWAQDFEHYLSTGETRVHPEPEPGTGPEHVPLPLLKPETEAPCRTTFGRGGARGRLHAQRGRHPCARPRARR